MHACQGFLSPFTEQEEDGTSTKRYGLRKEVGEGKRERKETFVAG
jgi:hypothetical protein